MIALSILALFPLFAPQVTGEEPREVTPPAPIEAVRDHLRSLEGSIRYSLLQEMHDLSLRSGPPRQKLDREARALAERVYAGNPPTYGEALELAGRCFDSIGSDGRVGPGRMWSEYTRSGDDALNVTTFSEGLHTAHLLSGDLALHFLSSANRILVKARDEHNRGSFLVPRRITYPVNVACPILPAFEAPRWSSERNDEEVIRLNSRPETDRCAEITPWGETLGTTWTVTSWDEYGTRFALFIQNGGTFPGSAVLFNPGRSDEDPEEYVLAFFRTVPAYSEARNPFGFYEVVRFDTSGLPGRLLVERMVLYHCELLESPEGEQEPTLKLPVRFTPQTIMQVSGEGRGARTYPAHRSTWPSEYDDLLEAWK